jgi:glycosyltransferase involved in cell wall biosynthesis
MEKASVIIPAYDEEQTIGAVIRVAMAHPLVHEVIVVADRCRDRTVVRAYEAGATTVIEPTDRHGKGEALDVGVETASSDILVFLDADLIGFTGDMLTTLIEPILRRDADMTILWRDQWIERTNRLHASVNLGGERCLRRAIWLNVPAHLRTGFKVELALNHAVLDGGGRIVECLAPGLTVRAKQTKHGLLRGTIEHVKEVVECAQTFMHLRRKGYLKTS